MFAPENIVFYLHLPAKHLRMKVRNVWRETLLRFAASHSAIYRNLKDIRTLYQVSIAVRQQVSTRFKALISFISPSFPASAATRWTPTESSVRHHQGGADIHRAGRRRSTRQETRGEQTKKNPAGFDKLPCAGQLLHHQN